MKKLLILLLLATTIFACKNDDSEDETFTPKFKFTFNWNGDPINLADFNDIKYTNENGEELSITRMRYLLSNIILTNSNDNETNVAAYNLVDLTEGLGLDLTSSTQLDAGEYKAVKFTFGFNETDNTSQAYSDLNIVGWNWPEMLGDGYHFMQYEGLFLDSNNEQQIYNLHMGTKRVSTNPNVFEANHFSVVANLPTGTNLNSDSEIEIKMNVAEWFKSPNLWDLNVLSFPLMPNPTAQQMMHENGASVFSVLIN